MASANSEWTQDGHDAQRTGYIADEPAEPWTLAWNWNGPDANGGSGGHIYNAPDQAHTVTGGSFVYAPAGQSGLYAVRKSDGSQGWRLTVSAFNATPAYDPATGSLYAGGVDGKLYKIDAATGSVQASYSAGSAINKAVLLVSSSAYIVTEAGELHKVNTANMSRVWMYAAGSGGSTPASYSAKAGVLVFASADLYVHAVRDADGSQQWRVKPTSHQAVDPYTFSGFWPVIAEQHGIVFVRLDLGTNAIWSGSQQSGIYPNTNAEVRNLLMANNGEWENLFALDLSSGSKKFIPAVGFGGTEWKAVADPNDPGQLLSGPVPVVKVNSDGSEVAYIAFRTGQGNPPDGRWDSHMGEMVLDDTTISGLKAGDMRYVDFPNSHVQITDEQTPFTMAGNTLFRAHWGASESVKILDRSASKGLSDASPITAQAHPAVIRRQQSCSDFNPTTHYTTCGLTLLQDGRYWNGPGFWVYWNVADPPTRLMGSYSDGLLPRYTYVSDGMIVVEGNGGELSVFRYNGSAPAPTPTSAPTSVKTATPLPAPTNTPTRVPPTATSVPTSTKVPTLAPTTAPTATRIPTQAPTTAPTKAPTAAPTATRAPTQAPTAAPTTVPANVSSVVLDTMDDFSQSCAVLNKVQVSDANNGMLELAPRLTDHFTSATVNTTRWTTTTLATAVPYTAAVANSELRLAGGGYVRSKTRYTHGTLEADASLDGEVGQNIGFGMDPVTGKQFFSFSTNPGDGNLYARVQNNDTEQLVNLGTPPAGQHHYRLTWKTVNSTTDGVYFYIDGAPVAQLNVRNTGARSWYMYVSNAGSGNISVNQASIAPTFQTSGSYIGCALDAGADSLWQSLSWTVTKPSGTALTIKVRTSADGTTWRAWTTVSSGRALKYRERFIQWAAYFSSTSSSKTPTLNSITLNKVTSGAAPAPTATNVPTAAPTATKAPTQAPSAVPTATRAPTQAPTAAPTATRTPTQAPTTAPTATRAPTQIPTAAPTAAPTTSPTQIPSGSRISNLKVVSASPAVYEKFEAQFGVQTSASKPDLPYDTNPPAGVQPGQGVTVNVLFSIDNWQTTITQPAFLYQPYTHAVMDGKDHLIPNGAPAFAVRFAPQKAGTWQYRISVQDSQGLSTYPASGQSALNFTASSTSSSAYVRKGFIGVSPTDQRYFQFQDGSPFMGVGLNDSITDQNSTEQRMTAFEQNKMNFMRVWLGGSGINGSQWTAWASHFLSNDNYLPGTSFDIANTYNGSPVSMRLDNANPCLFADFWRGSSVPVEPNTTYTVTARVKVTGITGPSASGDYGFVIKQGAWLDKACANSGTGKRITSPLAGTSDWTTVTGSYTTGSTDNWLSNLYLTRENATGGQVYIDEVHMYRANDPAKVDLLRQPNADAIEYYDQMSAAQWDLFIQSAEKHGVYLKLVTDEKNEWIRNRIGTDGKISSTGDNNNFYAASGTKVRWLEQAWWRYMIARWGYSTAIHSFEYVNEGDPYNSNHYNAVEAMAKYFHQNDPSHHMVTTSFWHSFPNAEFWSNTQFPDVDYADLHAYITTGFGPDASFIPQSMQETSSANVHSGSTSARLAGATQSSTSIVPRGMVVQGQGEWVIRYWMKASGLTASCPYSGSGSMARVRWQLDGGNYNGGREGVVPSNSEAKDYVCTSPAGTFDWKQFNSTADRDGTALPTTARIVVSDNNPHALNVFLENSSGTGGTLWIDDVQIVSPSGQVQPVIGTFETTQFADDTAWYTAAYSQIFGAGSPLGAKKPVVRGEAGVDSAATGAYDPDLKKDTQGIWLHNDVWGQINAGGMYDLFWWATETIPASIYSNYQTYQNFMQGIPLNNGHYKDSQATSSNAQLRVLGQRDDTAGQMHLWVMNTQHTWKRVIAGTAISAQSGTITIPNVASGSYKVEWWNTYKTSSPIILTQTISASGSLTLTLPSAIADDVAIKIYKTN